MIIHRLRLVNFRQHENTDIEFGSGLTGIVGPNGAGKTTLLEAIAWAMYGMPAARGNKESIKRRGAPPRAVVEVELTFSLGPHRYRVMRKMGGAELYLDASDAPIATGIGPVTDRVTRLMGMRRDEFFNTYFTGQKELAVMSAMKPTERAQFLSRVLGYERLRIAQDRLRLEKATLRARLDTLRSGLPDPVALQEAVTAATERCSTAEQMVKTARKEVQAADRRHAELGPKWAAAQKQREAASALDSELRLAQRDVETTGREVLRLAAELQAATAASARAAELGTLLAPLPSLREEAAALTRDAEGNNRRAAKGAERKELVRRRKELAKVIEKAPSEPELEEATIALNTLREARDFTLRSLEARRTLWVQDTQEAKTKREGLRDQYKDLAEQRKRIVSAGAEGECPTCGRPLQKEYESVLGVLDRQAEEVKFNGAFYARRLEQLKDTPAEVTQLEQQLQELERKHQEAVRKGASLAAAVMESTKQRAEMALLDQRLAALEADLAELPGVVYDQERHAQVQAELKRLEPLALELERHRVVADRLGSVQDLAATAETSRVAAQAREARVRVSLAELAFSEVSYRALEDEWAEAERVRQDAALAMIRVQGEMQSAIDARAQALRLVEDRARRAREADEVALQLRTNQELDAALGDLRDELNAALRPDLSDLASGFLRDLTNGRYTELELDEEYKTALLDEGEAKGVISGGEEDIANLALRLAISQMIAERAGQPLSLLILDEIFGSLDEDHRASVVELLRNLADRFPQVILITHIDSVRDGFDRIVRVTFDQRRGTSLVAEEQLEGDDVAA
jgi:exonuclease SbcC